MKLLWYILLIFCSFSALSQNASHINGVATGDISLVDGINPSNASRIWSGVPNLTPWYVVDGDTATQAYQAKGAASYQASLISLTGTDTINDNNSPTWSTLTGWSFDGVSDYITIPHRFHSTGHTMLVKFSGYSSGDLTPIFGTPTQPSQRFAFYPQRTWGSRGWKSPFNTTDFSGAMTSGIICITAKAAQSHGYEFKDGIESGQAIINIYASENTALGKAWNAYGQVTISAVAIFDDFLSPLQIQTLTEKMQAL